MEEHVEFEAGDVRLEGLLAQPAGADVGVVICHPHPLYGGNMDNNVVMGLAQAFQNAGMATLRFNFRGVGRSDGEHGGGETELADVQGAVTCLLARAQVATQIVAGYSFGSFVGLRAGADDARVAALIGVALPIARRDMSFLVGVAKPTLLIAGDRDDIGPAAMMAELCERCAEPKALEVVKGGDHFFGGREREVGRLAAEWVRGLGSVS
ncbi:MAG: alpha/beta fold hydrolase [Proteobacteria bacterium]|nr:alpha/beta fold hydrolase [Pseudomonadota bacterium]